jgi:hypothetical protein
MAEASSQERNSMMSDSEENGIGWETAGVKNKSDLPKFGNSANIDGIPLKNQRRWQLKTQEREKMN